MGIMGGGDFPPPMGCWVTAVLVLWASPIRGAYGDHDSLREEEVKAAFVFNFLKFVEWPEERDGRSVVILCVQATSPLVDALVALDARRSGGAPCVWRFPENRPIFFNAMRSFWEAVFRPKRSPPFLRACGVSPCSPWATHRAFACKAA